MAKTGKRKRCTHPGCRKLQAGGIPTCGTHADLRPPLEGVVRMTDIERLSLVNAETECVNFILQLRNHDLETEDIKRKLVEQLQSRAAHRMQLHAMAETKKVVQQNMVKEIAEKYSLDAQQMTYDPDTGVLRDMRIETKGPAKQ